MKVLTRYLLRAHLGPFLFAFATLTGVILINTLARQLADLAGKGLPLRVVFQFFLLSLPSNIALTFPMAVLVAVLYTFSQLTAENEIMALKAGGVDLKRMVMPLLLAAALITTGMIWFNDQVLPESNHRWQQLMVDIGRKSPLFTLREQTINRIPNATGGPRYYLQAARIDPTTNRMQDVVIYDVGNPHLSRTIYADSGQMAFNQARTDLFLTLYDGHLREIDLDEPQSFQRLAFGEQVLRMEGVANVLERQEASGYRGDRELTIGMMDARIDTLRSELAEVKAEAASEEDSAEWEQIRAESIQREIRSYKVEIHKKYSIAAATLVFVLIGVPLALRFPQGGVGMVIAISLAIFALYYVGLIGGETLADEGYTSPTVAMWIVNAIMAALGILGLTRLGRESSSLRGGGGSGPWRGLRSLFRRPPREPRRHPATAPEATR